MNQLSTQILQGSEISEEDLEVINKYRKIRLNRETIWDHKINNFFHKRTFFLIKDNDELVSFGVLKPVEIFIDETKHNILGIQSIISIVQAKGYGKILMTEIKKYGEEQNLPLIGFCEPTNSEFYRKCGYEIFSNKNKNFIYIDENKKQHTDEGDVIYYYSNTSPIKQSILKDEKIFHYVPHW